MIYLDYSATTPVDKEVLETFNKVSLEYPGNVNSFHKLGLKSKNLEEEATNKLASILKVKPTEIIYTSGASEANNLAIKGTLLKYQNRGRHIITSSLEHSSVIAPLNYLTTLGFEVDFVKIKDDGLVDLDDLKRLLREDTILVSISLVDSELGIKQDVEKIANILKDYPKCFFHVDMTQGMGKIKESLENIDLASFSAHKFYGLKGVGVLVKKEKIMLEPLIHGGKSTTIFRSGTPALPLMVSLVKALDLIDKNIHENYSYVDSLNKDLKEFLGSYDNVYINSTENSLPFTINFSIIGIKPETFVHALEEDDIYISTKSACSNIDSISNSVMALTNDEKRASSTLRISLSYLTTKEEIEKFKESFDKNYKRLMF